MIMIKPILKLTVLFLLTFLMICFSINCQTDETRSDFSLLNFSHLRHLSQDITMNGRTVSIVKIYAEYPDYHPVEAEGEGIACVDDVARAAILYLRHFSYSQQKSSLDEARKMLDFLLEMQAPNGLFYNFVLTDHSINKERVNSQPLADWWSWRALWALAEGSQIYRQISPSYYDTLLSSVGRTFPAIDSLLEVYPQTVTIAGLDLPRWLPYGSAADQAAVAIIGLSSYWHSTARSETSEQIRKLAEGIIKMQRGDSLHFPWGCFLSWENFWHAYGNSQAFALFKAAEISGSDPYVNKALSEVDYFYPFLLNQGMLSSFEIRPRANEYIMIDRQDFTQIAYGIRPMVWSSLEANKVTGQERYAELAGEIACWLLGKNAVRTPLYDPLTGRCFDGIEDPESFNQNSGAESTIEALLTLLEIERNPVAREIVHDYYQRIHKK
jgi:hypothetical protein